jgi:hypothetical protein
MVATRQRQPRKTPEADLERAVIEFAERLGYLVHGVRPAVQKSGSFSDPLKGRRGYPDLTLVGKVGVVFLELKSEKGRLDPDQIVWRDALLTAGARYGVIRPEQWHDGTVDALLRGADVELPIE